MKCSKPGAHRIHGKSGYRQAREDTLKMTTRLNPYLGFEDNAREAMDFYQSVFGGELALSTCRRERLVRIAL